MEDFKEFVGTTLEEAKEKARDYFNSNQIEFEMLPPKLLTMITGKRDIRIKARKKEISEEYLASKQRLKELLDSIIKRSGFTMSITEQMEGDTTRYILTGEDLSYFTEDKGRLLDSVQHILVKAAFKTEQGVNIVVDADDIKKDREEYIKSYVQKACSTVRRSNKPYILRPMTPGDRRMVHIMVKEQGDLASESEGDGLYKKVRIFKKPAC
ncbi:MAG: R3H domain-containing nucleic acid-binding protein [Pseudomonadota bacterium]